MNLRETIYPRRTFYMVRHGETNQNVQGVLNGMVGSKLNQRGSYQGFGMIEEVIESIKADKKHASDRIEFYCSDLDRAQETAVMAGVDDKDIIVDRRLNERNFGDYDGRLTLEELRKMDSKEQKRAGVQTRKQHRHQVLPAIEEHLATPHAVPIFFVHAGTINRVLERLNVREEKIQNGVVFRFKPMGRHGWEVSRLVHQDHGTQWQLVGAAPGMNGRNMGDNVRG